MKLRTCNRRFRPGILVFITVFLFAFVSSCIDQADAWVWPDETRACCKTDYSCSFFSLCLSGYMPCTLFGCACKSPGTGFIANGRCPKPCINGYYRSSSTSCSACAAGMFNGDTPSAACSRCGTASWSASGASSCTLCAAGNKGKSGSGHGSAAAACEQCPAGTHQPSPGLLTCINCPAGKWCPVGSATPLECPAGKWCAAATTSPVPCPVGSFSASTNLSAQNQCTVCSAGRACTLTGLTAPNTDCGAGTYCVSGARSTGAVFQAGPLGGDGGTCPIGYYCPTGTTRATEFPCAAGTWSSTSGATTSCPNQIPPGTSRSATTGCTNQACAAVDCPRGYYSTVFNSASCTAAAVGYRTSTSIRATSVVICPKNTFSVGATDACTDCQAGTETVMNSGATEAAACTVCAAGKRGLGAGLGCVVCSRGTFLPAGHPITTVCTAAARGYYVPADGAAEQTPVGLNYYTDTEGSSTRRSCASGYVTSGHTSTSERDCAPCPKATYFDEQARVCRQCQRHESTRRNASIGIASCVPCVSVDGAGCTRSFSVSPMSATPTASLPASDSISKSKSPPRTVTHNVSESLSLSDELTNVTLSESESPSAATESKSFKYTRSSRSLSASGTDPTDSASRHRVSNTTSVSETAASSLSLSRLTETGTRDRNSSSQSVSASSSAATESETRHRNSSSISMSASDSGPTHSFSDLHNTSSESASVSRSGASESGSMHKNTSTRGSSETVSLPVSLTLSQSDTAPSRTIGGSGEETASSRSREVTQASVTGVTATQSRSAQVTLSESQSLMPAPLRLGLSAGVQEQIETATELVSMVMAAAAAPAAASLLRQSASQALVGCSPRAADGRKWADSIVPFPASLFPGARAGEGDGRFSRMSVISYLAVLVFVFALGLLSTEVMGCRAQQPASASADDVTSRLDQLNREREQRDAEAERKKQERRTKEEQQQEKEKRNSWRSHSDFAAGKTQNRRNDDLSEPTISSPRHENSSATTLAISRETPSSSTTSPFSSMGEEANNKRTDGGEEKDEQAKKKKKKSGMHIMLTYIAINGSIGIFAPQAGLTLGAGGGAWFDILLTAASLITIFALHVHMSRRLMRSMQSEHGGILFAPARILESERGAVVNKHGCRSARCVLESRIGRFCLLGERFWTTQRGSVGWDGDLGQVLLSQLGGQLQKFRGPATDQANMISTANPFEESIQRHEALDESALRGDFESSEHPQLVREPNPSLATRVSPHFLLFVWFFSAAVGLLQGLALGIVEAETRTQPERLPFCPTAARIIAALNVCAFLVSLWLRPFVVPLRNWLMVSADGIVAVSSVLSAVLLTEPPQRPSPPTAAETARRQLAMVLQVGTGIVGIIISVGFLSITAIRMAYLVFGKSRVCTEEELWSAAQYHMSRTSLDNLAEQQREQQQREWAKKGRKESSGTTAVATSASNSPTSSSAFLLQRQPSRGSGSGRSRRSLFPDGPTSSVHNNNHSHTALTSASSGSGSMVSLSLLHEPMLSSSGDYYSLLDDDAFLHEMMMREEKKQEDAKRRLVEREIFVDKRLEQQRAASGHLGLCLSRAGSAAVSPLNSPVLRGVTPKAAVTPKTAHASALPISLLDEAERNTTVSPNSNAKRISSNSTPKK